MKTKLTYNNSFGEVNCDEFPDVIHVKRNACVRAWQKVSNRFGGGADLIFDTNKKVIDECDRKYSTLKWRKTY